MFSDARSVPEATAVETDVCIVGCGAAGITLAREFDGSSFRVIVLESGDFEYDDATQALYQGAAIGLPYSTLDKPRLRFFGGTTNHWGGICRPFEDGDFEPRDNIPFTGWPIRRADLEPFYGPAAVICGLRSQEWDLGHWAERDRHAPLPFESDRIVSRVTQSVPRDARRFGLRYRDEIERLPTVTVYLHANVTSIETDESGSSATLLNVATLAGNRFTLKARLFIVATGAIENARLLLASTGQSPNGVGNQNDLVGRFFYDHARFVGGAIMPSKRSLDFKFYDTHPVGTSSIRGYLGTTKQFQLDEGLLDVQFRPEPVFDPRLQRVIEAASVESLKDLTRSARRGRLAPDFGHHVATVMEDIMTWQSYAIPGAPVPVPYPEVVGHLMGSSRREIDELIPELLGDVAGRAYVERADVPIRVVNLSTRIEQAPNPDSRVVMTSERDQLGMPRVALDWRLSRIDRHNVRRSLEVLGAEVGAAGIGRLKILFDENAEGWPDDLGGGSHHMGTTRMSDDPKQGVVDRNCRIHGMSNVFIAGSSVFPTSGGGTPTMTLVALALRLAGHIKEVMRR